MQIIMDDEMTFTGIMVHTGTDFREFFSPNGLPEESVKIVAVKGTIDDWSAYVSTADKTIEEIAVSGIKLTKAEAGAIFPLLNPKLYRR